MSALLRCVLAAALVACGLAAPAVATYGGRPATGAEADTVAYFTVIEGNSIAECSGALIGRRHVLTAAHCVRPERPGGRVQVVGRTVRLGNPGRHARTATVLRAAVHPRYRNRDPRAGYDLAVLTLSRPVGTPLAIATAEEERQLAAPPANAVAAGFGITRIGQSVRARPAHAVRLEVLSPYNCVTPGLVDGFQRTQVCAASGTQGICAGDSGGPLTVATPDGSMRLVGIASLAIEEVSCRNVVGVFSRVAAMRNWVVAQMRLTSVSGSPPAPPPPSALLR